MLDRQTQQGSALYFCLEDSYPRIQSRLYELTDEPSDKLFFALRADTIGNGLEEQIIKFKSEHDDLLNCSAAKIRAKIYQERGILAPEFKLAP